MAKVTIEQIAQQCGLSTATVDRVLNERPGVSVKSRRRVKSAVSQLGYGRLPASLLRNSKGRVSLVFLLPNMMNALVKDLVKFINLVPAQMPEVELLIEIRHIDFHDPQSLSREIRKASHSSCDGIGLFAIDTPEIVDEVEAAINRGKKVVTLVSDVPSSRRNFYAGIDNLAAGRMAGRLMGNFIDDKSGLIGIIAGSLQIRDQAERYRGFREVIHRDFKELRILPLFEGDSFSARNFEIVKELLCTHPDLKGLYSLGGGNSGIVKFLNEETKARPTTIVHDLNADTRMGLKIGLISCIIHQSSQKIASTAVRSLIAEVLGETDQFVIEPIVGEIFLPEHLT